MLAMFLGRAALARAPFVSAILIVVALSAAIVGGAFWLREDTRAKDKIACSFEKEAVALTTALAQEEMRSAALRADAEKNRREYEQRAVRLANSELALNKLTEEADALRSKIDAMDPSKNDIVYPAGDAWAERMLVAKPADAKSRASASSGGR